MNNRTYLCKCHPDFHLPPEVTVGNEFNGYDYARRAGEAGVESLVAFAKDHYGFAYYDTAVGTRHPGLVKDMLNEFSRGCRKEGLRVTFYYSVFLDAAAGRKHHDWVFRPAGGTLEEQLSKKYVSICVNSGYLEELMLPQIMELMDGYDVDELFFDTMNDFHPCYCDNCRRLFGGPIPENSDDPRWQDYVKWYYGNFTRFFDRVLQAIHDKNPNVDATVNWKWSGMLPETPPPIVHRLAGDLFTSGDTASYYCHYWAGTGYPFDYMCGRFLHGLGDWTCGEPATLKYVAASAIANGGGFYLIDRQLPAGGMEERAYALMKDVFGFIDERRSWVEGTAHVPETAVLHSMEHLVGPDFEYFPDYQARTERARGFRGISSYCMHRAVHYTAVNKDVLKQRLGDYRLLILPESEFLDGEARAAIAAFVERGGKLMIVQNCHLAHMDGALLDLAGVEYLGQTEAGYSYIGNQAGGIADPILVRGYAAMVRPKDGAETVARFVEPLFVGAGGAEFGHGFAPATARECGAAVTLRPVGAGAVMYAAAPLLTSYETYVSPPIARLLQKLLGLLLPDPIAEARFPAQIELSAMRQGGDLIVHFVNHSGKEEFAGVNMRHLPVTEYVPPLYDIPVSIKSPAGRCEVSSYPDGIVSGLEEDGGRLSFLLKKLEIMASVRVTGYFMEVAQ